MLISNSTYFNFLENFRLDWVLTLTEDKNSKHDGMRSPRMGEEYNLKKTTDKEMTF